MNKLVFSILVSLLLSLPVHAETLPCLTRNPITIVELVDSDVVEQLIYITDKNGYIKLIRNKYTMYKYKQDNSEFIYMPQKIPHLVDSRELEKKHPIINKLGKLINFYAPIVWAYGQL